MKRKMLGGLLGALAAPGIFALAFDRQAGKTPAEQDARKSLDAFNQEWIGTCQKMDNAAATALWAEDGADLLQGMAPMIGKAKITEWLNSLTPQLAGAKMIYCTVDWQDIQIHGDIAYEWGINKQKIEFPPPQKPFEGAGKILLIVKRQADGAWKIEVETWNSLPQPEEKP
ncbi:MAG: YybH family protein [Candidatus Acidiferrales bacterium]